MPRLPHVGGDAENWGEILNEYLRVVHAEDGSLKNGVVKAPQLGVGSVTNAALADNAISDSKLASGLRERIETLESVTGGRNIEIRATSTHIQWKYVDESTWTDLVALDELKGADGEKGETGETGPVGPAGTTSWSGIVDKPSVFAPENHTHEIDQIVSLQSRLSDMQNDLDELLLGLGGKVGNDDPRLIDSRTPTAHAISHTLGGSDPLTPASIGAQPAATGTPDGTRFLRDDNTWAAVPSRGIEHSPLAGGLVQLTRSSGNGGVGSRISAIFLPTACYALGCLIRIITGVSGCSAHLVVYTQQYETYDLLYNLAAVDFSNSTEAYNINFDEPLYFPSGLLWIGFLRNSDISGGTYRTGDASLPARARDVNNFGTVEVSGYVPGDGATPPTTFSNPTYWGGGPPTLWLKGVTPA